MGEFPAALQRYVEFLHPEGFSVIIQHQDEGGNYRIFGGCGQNLGFLEGIFESLPEG